MKRSHAAALVHSGNILNKSFLCNSQLIVTHQRQAILELWATFNWLLSLIAFRRSNVNATFRTFIWLCFKLLEGQAVPAWQSLFWNASVAWSCLCCKSLLKYDLFNNGALDLSGWNTGLVNGDVYYDSLYAICHVNGSFDASSVMDVATT